MDHLEIIGDEAIESYEEDAEAKSYVKANFNEKGNQPVKCKVCIFYLHFY